MKVKDWDILRYIDQGYYLVKLINDDSPVNEIVANKERMLEHLGVDEKELDEILAQIK